MTLASGTKLGRYEIRSKIGEGGMGEVYLAQDTELNRKVAIKLLPANADVSEQTARRFVREARMAASAILTHEPLPVARFARDVPGELERIAGKALRRCG